MQLQGPLDPFKRVLVNGLPKLRDRIRELTPLCLREIHVEESEGSPLGKAATLAPFVQPTNPVNTDVAKRQLICEARVAKRNLTCGPCSPRISSARQFVPTTSHAAAISSWHCRTASILDGRPRCATCTLCLVVRPRGAEPMCEQGPSQASASIACCNCSSPPIAANPARCSATSCCRNVRSRHVTPMSGLMVRRVQKPLEARTCGDASVVPQMNLIARLRAGPCARASLCGGRPAVWPPHTRARAACMISRLATNLSHLGMACDCEVRVFVDCVAHHQRYHEALASLTLAMHARAKLKHLRAARGTTGQSAHAFCAHDERTMSMHKLRSGMLS